MKKRILSLLLVFVLLCGTWSIASVSAYSETDIAYPVEGGNIYFDKETGTITDCDFSVTKADIPSEIDGVAVTCIGSCAFYNCTELMSVKLPESVTGIDYSAFEGCSSLTSVEIPRGVTSIDADVFKGCNSLNRVTIPSGVTSIGYSAFDGCSSLASVTIPYSVASIGPRAFANTAIYNAEDHWSGDVLYIDNWLISAKGSLEGAYTVRAETVGIAGDAFIGCTSLTNITIPKEVVSIATGVYASFHFCPKLSDIVVVEENTAYASENGVLFNKEKTTLLDYPMGRADTAYVIPSGVTTIADWALFGSAIESVTIPETVKHIGRYAFNHCSGLTEVIIPDGVVSIGGAAFEYCEKLSSVTISDTVTSIDGYAFAYSGLTSVKIGNGVTSIDGGTFYACEKLTSVTLPESVTSIEAYAFGVCTGLANIDIPDGVESIGSNAFECCGFTSVMIPASIISIGSDAFRSCNDLTSVYFMGNAPEVGKRAFQTWGGDGFVNIPALTLYYIEGKEGWTSPTWNGYPTATWVPAHEHSYAAAVSAPTCTEKGYTTHTCECGESYADTYVAALGHDFGLWTQTKAPTCTEKGEEKRTCSRCEALETRELAALEHSYENGACVRCGEKDPNAQEPVTFTDVPKDEWYVGAVEYAVQNGLMNGVGDGKFAPEGSMTRAMLVTVLWRYEGAPETGKNPFTDVPNGQWYTDAVAWAAANGIVGGVGNNKFDPEGKITREQMATILYRYAEKKGIDTGKRGDLSAFPDGGKVASWAKNAVQWAVAEKIINGSDGKLLPQGDATRAQVATILMRFIENIVKK